MPDAAAASPDAAALFALVKRFRLCPGSTPRYRPAKVDCCVAGRFLPLRVIQPGMHLQPIVIITIKIIRILVIIININSSIICCCRRRRRCRRHQRDKCRPLPMPFPVSRPPRHRSGAAAPPLPSRGASRQKPKRQAPAVANAVDRRSPSPPLLSCCCAAAAEQGSRDERRRRRHECGSRGDKRPPLPLLAPVGRCRHR